MIGNAVPVRLAAYMARAIQISLNRRYGNSMVSEPYEDLDSEYYTSNTMEYYLVDEAPLYANLR
jgi:hypothetical protein